MAIEQQAMWNPKVARKFEEFFPTDLRYLSWSQLYLHLREWRRHGEPAITTVQERYGDHIKKNEESGRFEVVVQQINPYAVDVYQTNLRQIQNLCEQLDIACYSILQPTLISANADREHEKVKNAKDRAAVYHGFGFDEHVRLFERFYAVNREVFGDRAIDATTMNGQTELFNDHIHQSPRGTQVLASLIFDRLSIDAGSGSNR